MSADLQWAWYDQGVAQGIAQERARILALLQTDEAFDAIYYDEMGAQGAVDDLSALINREEPDADS